jgi:hypothetical protein
MPFRKLWFRLAGAAITKNARGRHVRLGSFASIPTAFQPVPFSAANGHQPMRDRSARQARQ